ncbi:MAG: sugar transferase [bacterium]
MEKILRKVLAIFLLIIAFPFLVLLTILIRMESKGNPIFKQKRVGKGGKIFIIYKLRTMRLGKEPEHITSSIELRKHSSYRVTCIGKYLRQTHTDELPQLWNVLKNEMTFVGPRPLTIPIATKKEYYAPRDENICPGITGITQISLLAETKGYNVSKLDKFYCKKRCLLLDLLIVISTPILIAFKKI